MANYRKSFNFRNGVQVDDDNLVVNANGLVGIGTTVPTEVLDVRGTAKVVGQVTASTLNVSGVSTFSDVRIGTGITIDASAGIITASKVYGDGSTLSNLPTSQWVDVDVGLGFTSIYAQGHVGVGTTDPRNAFQVGGDPYNSGNGVGFSSITGDIRTSGILTASSFVGSGAGVTSLNASNILTGTISTDRVPQLTNAKMPSSISVSGIITATGGFIGSVTGNVTGDVVGDLTGDVTGNLTGNVTGNVTGTATTATALSGTPDITVGTVTATRLVADSIDVPSTGITTVARILNVGIAGTIMAVTSSAIGIGTASPSSSFEVIRSSNSALDLVSQSGQSRISIGNSVGLGNSTALIRYGNLARGLEIINNDTGDIRTIIHEGGVGSGSTGNFKWIYGQNNSERMTLTWDGKLGINNTSPTNTLDIVGTSTVTGNAWVGGNLTVAGAINGSITFPTVITNSNLNNTSGITTLAQLNVSTSADFGSTTLVALGNTVAIGTASGSDEFSLVVEQGLRADRIEVQSSGGIDANAGIVTASEFVASGGFRMQGISTAVEIFYASSPDRVVFNVVGIGSTSLQLL